MKTLYLDCAMGAAGDMLMAALLELVPAPESFLTKLNCLGIPGVEASRQQVQKCGINGTQVTVTVHGVDEGEEHSHGEHSHGGHNHSHGETPHHHGSMAEIEAIIRGLPVSQWVADNALAVYKLIAQAESHAHGVEVTQVHFHEVGAMDAIADVVGVCLLLEELAPQRILASPVHLGSGQVKCAHGVLPVPAPATAHILRGVPAYGGEIAGELCTPTGAALLKHFVHSFGPMPTLAVEQIGYGMGKKDFAAANCLRAMVGQTQEAGQEGSGPNHRAVQLCCNLDDMTGEAIGFALERLLDEGALDVFVQPITMKKSRPAQMLTCIVEPEQADRFAALMLRHTTTFGVRRTSCDRYVLGRSFVQADTNLGPVSIKTGSGYGVEKYKPEYEDIAAIAKQKGVPISAVLQSLEL